MQTIGEIYFLFIYGLDLPLMYCIVLMLLTCEENGISLRTRSCVKYLLTFYDKFDTVTLYVNEIWLNGVAGLINPNNAVISQQLVRLSSIYTLDYKLRFFTQRSNYK